MLVALCHVPWQRRAPRVQVKKKMTCDEFLRNNRGINDGQNLPPEFLQAIYDSIVRNEIRTTSEAETGAFEVRSIESRCQTFQSKGSGSRFESCSHEPNTDFL